MPNINDKNVKPETTKEKPNKETKKVRKPREKVRAIEELMTLPITKLTDKEKNKLIKELKGKINLNDNKYEQYKMSAESAFNKAREIEAKYDAMEQYYRRLLTFVDTQVNAFHASLNQAIKKEV